MFKFWYEFIPKATSVIEMGQGEIYYQKIVKPVLHSFYGFCIRGNVQILYPDEGNNG